MDGKRVFACFAAAVMMCGALTSCKDKKDPSKEISIVNESTPDEEPAVVLEDLVAAKPGEACLIVSDGKWQQQYWGKAEDGLLAYGATTVRVDRDGEYTVRLSADTKGYKYKTTGKIDGDAEITGLKFAAVRLVDGASLYPDISMDITKIVLDGKEIPMIAKNYTSSNDDKEMRATIFNSYASQLPKDAHTAEGNVYGQEDIYKSEIVDTADFDDGWKTLEVTFIAKGTGRT